MGMPSGPPEGIPVVRTKQGIGVPAYRQIQDSLRKRIQSGELKVGDLVPPERELSRIHKVSLMTARHAVTSLEQEGLVERRQGVGTFVSKPKILINELLSTTEQLASRGQSAKAKILSARTVHGEQEIVARLALPLESVLVKLERLRHADGEPFSLEISYLSDARFPGLLKAPFGRESLFKLLEVKYNETLGHADEEIDATLPDTKTADLLGIAKTQPVLRIRQVIHSTSGVPLIYVLGFYRSDRYSVAVRRLRRDKASHAGASA
jgi:GntR family transcriptional regulator